MDDVLVNLYNKIVGFDLNTKVIYGAPTDETEDTIISVSVGDGEERKSYFGEARDNSGATLNMTVYSKDYLCGYAILKSLKNGIAKESKAATGVVHHKDKASYYDKDLRKHVLTAQYKILI